MMKDMYLMIELKIYHIVIKMLVKNSRFVQLV